MHLHPNVAETCPYILKWIYGSLNVLFCLDPLKTFQKNLFHLKYIKLDHLNP